MDTRKPLNFTKLWELTDKKNSREMFWGKEKSEQRINKLADDALQASKEAAVFSLPFITTLGIKMMCDSGGGGGYFNFSLAPLGLPVAIGGIVLDTIKAPIGLAIASEEAVRGGITKLVSLLFEKGAVEQSMERIFNSFLLRMRQTATILIALELEKPDVLDEKFKSGDIEELIGLTLLHTAYASRHSSGLLLAEEKHFYRSDCAAEGLPLFDATMELKNLINQALKLAFRGDRTHRKEDEQNIEESRVVCQWIADIRAGVFLDEKNKPDATKEQLEIVNKIISQIQKLKQFAMMVLPETTENLARKVRK